ncbi:hypothetical protein BJX64DRAFT_295233 [Aspergillus heterothallicus]
MFVVQAVALLGFWCHGLFAYAHPLETRQAPAIEDTFNLYAYGESISGLPVFYADGKAEIGDCRLSTAKVSYPIYFTTSSSSSSTWIAHANTTGTGVSGDFADTVLTLPSTGAADGTVLFKPKTAASASSSSIFNMYGNYVLINAEDANFYAVPTGVDGVYTLIWSDVGSEQIAVILRTIAPATDTLL